MLELGEVDEDELYAALDWLLERQPAIEATLARRITSPTAPLVLYDVLIELHGGTLLPARQAGLPAVTARRARCKIVYGLLCAPDGCPVAIEVFDGNTADPMTLATQIEKLKRRFQLDHVVLVGDPRHDHPGAHHRGHQIGRPGLDLLAARTSDQGAGGKRNALAALAVRPARHGLYHRARIPR